MAYYCAILTLRFAGFTPRLRSESLNSANAAALSRTAAAQLKKSAAAPQLSSLNTSYMNNMNTMNLYGAFFFVKEPQTHCVC